MNMENYTYEKIEHTDQIPALIAIVRKKDIDQFPNDMFIHSHWHRSIEVSLIEHAKCILQRGSHKEIIENDFTCVNSGEVHSITPVRFDEDVHCIILVIAYDFVKQVYPKIDQVIFDLSIKKDHSDLYALYMKLEELYLHQNEFSYLKITACLLEILNCLLENYCLAKDKSMKKSARYQEEIKEILSYLHDHYQEDLSLKNMSEHFSMSQEHFSRKFHQYVGKTFRDYLTDYRLIQAYEDIIHTDLTIQDISQKHGFLNVKSLIHAFSSFYHETPLQYRKRHVQ